MTVAPSEITNMLNPFVWINLTLSDEGHALRLNTFRGYRPVSSTSTKYASSVKDGAQPIEVWLLP